MYGCMETRFLTNHIQESVLILLFFIIKIAFQG